MPWPTSPRHLVAALLVLSGASCAHDAPVDGLSPSLVKAAELSGDAAAASGQPEAAAGLYERAYRAYPSPELAVRWGRALRAAGQAQAAVIDLRNAAARFPNNGAMLTELGRCAAVGGYRAEAADAFSRAVKAPGVGWATYMAYGSFEASVGSMSSASGLFARAVETASNDRERYAAQANAALLRAQAGDLRGGISALEEITSHPGVDAKAHADLALLYGIAGDRAGYERQIGQAGLAPDDAARASSWLYPSQPTSPPTRPQARRRGARPSSAHPADSLD